MLNRKDYYAIYIETNERDGREVDYFETFEEAMNNRMKYANWYCPNGDIWICKKSGKRNITIEEWHIDSAGYTVNHFKWGD